MVLKPNPSKVAWTPPEEADGPLEDADGLLEDPGDARDDNGRPDPVPVREPPDDSAMSPSSSAEVSKGFGASVMHQATFHGICLARSLPFLFEPLFVSVH